MKPFTWSALRAHAHAHMLSLIFCLCTFSLLACLLPACVVRLLSQNFYQKTKKVPCFLILCCLPDGWCCFCVNEQLWCDVHLYTIFLSFCCTCEALGLLLLLMDPVSEFFEQLTLMFQSSACVSFGGRFM